MYPIDALDIAILGELESDARQPVSTLARRLDSPVSTIRDRIQRLQRADIILGYTVRIDYERLGFPIKAVIRTTRDQSVPIKDFVTEAIKLPEIASVQLLTGDTDEHITIYVRSVRHLRDFLYRQIMQLPGVLRTSTIIILSEIEPPYLLRALSGPDNTYDDLDAMDFEGIRSWESAGSS
jgi:Lrp/AsnC family transcriptional regulator for asnA, asnC and gidA